MTGADLYLVILGPVLAALAGVAVWMVGRGTWTPEYRSDLYQTLDETADCAGEGRKTSKS